MLRKIRITLATLFFVGITALFLDFTGALHTWLGWMAKVQLLPALLALNVGVVAALVLLTIIFGRVYCSVICPLGVMQDLFGWMGKRAKRNRYSFSPEKTWLRVIMLTLFVISLCLGGSVIAQLLAPYSAYGRIASNLLAPLYRWGNNGLAFLAERMGSYAFYEVEVWVRSGVTFAVALATLGILGVLAWRNGRTYCNTICPVGTVLGYIARFSWLKPVIDTTKCNSCGLCERNCKAACINSKEKRIDYTRCVACMDCIGTCKKQGIKYMHRKSAKAIAEPAPVDTSRRTFLTTTAMVAATTAIKAQEMKVDGGLAAIQDKVVPDRQTHLVPPGALSARNFAKHCTACQLCVSACPNDVLTPSTDLTRLMQPEMTYERGYCRPECTKCSEVCPTGAIRPITREDKSSTQIGHAVWVKKNCIPLTDGVECGNCARHCPVGAIQMIHTDGKGKGKGKGKGSPKIPVIDIERCIGCGACEHLCPARPFSAIYVEGHERHKVN